MFVRKYRDPRDLHRIPLKFRDVPADMKFTRFKEGQFPSKFMDLITDYKWSTSWSLELSYDSCSRPSRYVKIYMS